MIHRPMIPDFAPHWLLRDGHSQTLAAVYLPQKKSVETATQRIVALSDGDRIVLHDNAPSDWQPGGRVALLVHGLAGSHASPYMRRIAAKLVDVGVRAFRIDLRTCGAGLRLARLPYHSGRSSDVREALFEITRLCPSSPIALLGFSMGANIALKLAGEAPDSNPQELESIFAACPPVDLKRCVRHLQRGVGRLYDRYFAKLLLRHIDRWQAVVPDAPRPTFSSIPRSIEEFDELFTGPVCGFGGSSAYYAESSAAQYVPAIRVPTLIVGSNDDPMVSPEPLRDLDRPKEVQLHLTSGGGHMGFLGRSNGDPDRSWLDWRAVEWVVSHGETKEA